MLARPQVRRQRLPRTRIDWDRARRHRACPHAASAFQVATRNAKNRKRRSVAPDILNPQPEELRQPQPGLNAQLNQRAVPRMAVRQVLAKALPIEVSWRVGAKHAPEVRTQRSRRQLLSRTCFNPPPRRPFRASVPYYPLWDIGRVTYVDYRTGGGGSIRISRTWRRPRSARSRRIPKASIRPAISEP